MANLPSQKTFYYTALQALQNLGGSADKQRIDGETAKLMGLSAEQTAFPHKASVSYFSRHITWALSALGRDGLLDSPKHGFWILTPEGWSAKGLDANAKPMQGDNMTKDTLPSYMTLISPTLEAMRELGGGGRKAHISEIVAKKVQLSEEALSLRTRGGEPIFGGSMDTLRKYLLKEELITQPRLGHWQLTDKGWAMERMDNDEIADEQSVGHGQTASQPPQDTQEQDSSMVRAEVPMPSISEMYTPTLHALSRLGGAGTVQQIHDEVAAILELTDKQLQVPHKDRAESEISYRLGWVRTRLKNHGMLENPRQGLWALTPKGEASTIVNPADLRPQPIPIAPDSPPQPPEDNPNNVSLPHHRDLISPTLEAMRELGGGGRKVHISNIVAEKANLTDEQLSLTTTGGSSVFYRLMENVRLHLLNAELITQPRLGHWQLTDKGWAGMRTNNDEIAGEQRSISEQTTSRRQPEAQEQASPLSPADVAMPSFNEYFTPVIQALRKLGGTGTNQEILEEVITIMCLTDAQVQRPHKGAGNQTEVGYRLGWARTWLKRYGLLENPRHGLWALTHRGLSVQEVDVEDLHQTVNAMLIAEKARDAADSQSPNPENYEKPTQGDKDMLPHYSTLISPTLEAMKELGGGGRKAHISEIVVEKANLTEEQLSLTYENGSSVFTLVMDGVRKYLLNAELITQPRLGHWQLTDKGWAIELTDSEEIPREQPSMPPQTTNPPPQIIPGQASQMAHAEVIPLDELIAANSKWQDELFATLNRLSGEQLQRFFLRIFKNEGITEVEALDSSHPDEIEGTMKSEGFMSMRVAFKFIRSPRMISLRELDDFRRAVQASGADKGLLLTFGTFSGEAVRQASRHGSRNIVPIDGKQLFEKLKDLSIGIKSEIIRVERVVVDKEWFAGL